MMGKYPFLLTAALVVCSTTAGEDRIARLAVADFDRLLAEIKPQPGESPWR